MSCAEGTCLHYRDIDLCDLACIVVFVMKERGESLGSPAYSLMP